MKISKNIFICALLVLMLLFCVNACSAEETLNETLGADVIDEVIVADAPTDELSASGDTFVVDVNGGGQYTSISSAVSAATGGETIFIKNGEYNETSKIDIGSKQLTFTGESREGVIIKSGDNDLFYTTTSGYSSLVISGVTFKDMSMTKSRTPIFVGGDGAVNITDCTFDNCASRYGVIRIFSSGSLTIDNCKFLNTKSSTNSYSSAIDVGGSSNNYVIKNTLIDGSSVASTNTENYIMGVIYNENSGTLTLDNVTISNFDANGKGRALITSKGNMNIKNSKFVNNNLYESNAYSALFLVNTGNKVVTIESSIIANNSEPNYIVSSNSGTSSFNLNYNNIQNNSVKLGINHQSSGTYTLDANYWGSNELPENVTADTWVVENNGEYKLSNGDALEKEIPGLTDEGGDEPQPVAYDVFVSPDGDGDGSTIDNPTDLVTALEIVPEGGTIFLCNGEYSLDTGMIISKSTNLIGESRDGVKLSFDQGFLIGNPENPMDDTFTVDSISFSKMTFDYAMGQAVIYVSANMDELNITDCAINEDLFSFIGVSKDIMGESMQTTGTFNFYKNVAASPSGVLISLDGNWNANINDNIFINDDSGANVIENNAEGTVNIEYNYWGSSNPDTSLSPENWIIFEATTNASEIYNDESAKITIKAATTDGSNVNSHLPDYPLTAELTAAGTLSQSNLELTNGIAYVTYTSNVARNDNVGVNILGDSLTVPITVKERYLGIIYVDTTGSDDNEGSINYPVATVGKAAELALVNGGSGQIIINEGTYVGNGFHVTGDLTVTGNGKVTLDANDEGRFFYMAYGDAAGKIELSNLILTNANGYGAAVYSFANELILDNITVVNTQADGYLISSKGKLTIKDSNITRSMSGNVIQQDASGDILINNTVFEDNSIVDTTSVMAVININSGSGSLVIEDSKFINNTARQGVIKGNYNYNIDVKGCEFIDNNNTASYGTIYASGGTMNVVDSIFVNNKAARSGGAIYVGYRVTATVDKCMFVNNTANTMNDEYYGDAIYNGNKLTVNNSVLLGDARNYMIYNDGENNVVNAQNNWWGTNDNPSSMNGVGYYEDDDWEEYDCPEVDVSNWVTMNATFTPEDAQAGDEVTVTAVFSNANLPDGINVTFTSTSGNLNTVASTVAGQASTTYTIDENDEAINATSGSAVIEMPIVEPLTNIVTNDTFFRFFDENGMLLDTIEFEELIFQGEFSDLVDTIIISDEIILIGDNAVLNNIALSIIGDDVTVTGFTLNENDANFTNYGGAAIYVSGSDVTLDNVSVTYNAPSEVEAKAIFANGADNFALINSEIIFTGANPGENHYRGLEVRNSDAAKIDNNTISAVLPAVPVDWQGTGIGQDLVLTVGIQGGNDVEFTNNRVNVNTNGDVGSYPTIDAVMVHSANDILIKGNNISHVDTTTEDGARYYYSLDIYNTTGTVEANNIIVNTTAGVDRSGTAYPIQLTGPFTVTIKDNNLTAISKGPIAGIYASNWAGAATLIVEDNNIDVSGYATTGNYALVAGIEAEIDMFKAYDNNITVVNAADYDDANQVIGVGIGSSYFYGDTSADIKGNNITVDGKYAVYYAKAVNTNVTDNTLYAHELKGDEAANVAGENNVVKDNLPYVGIIYVNATGSDDNKGSADSPVATVAKAVELALGNSGQIIIDEGTYDCPQIEITGNLNISTVGEVVLKAQDATKKAFWIKSGDVSISNLTFTNFNATYSGSVIRMNDGTSLTLDGTKFIKNGGQNQQALIQVSNADLTLLNSVFDGNTARDGTAYGTVYVSGGTLYVDNCNFTNNFNKYGALYVSQSIATIYNSSFIGHNATSASGGSGAGIYVAGTATYISTYSGNLMAGKASNILVQGCSFINNTAKGARLYAGQGGAIYVGTNVTMFISDCLFENNTCTDNTGDSYVPGQGGAIYAAAGNIQIDKSIFKNNNATEGSEIYLQYKTNSILHPEELNTLIITDSIILNDGVAILATSDNGTYIANDNWWGTNDEVSDKAINVTVDSWAILNATFTPEDAQAGDEVTVTATISNPDLPEVLDVTFTSTSGLNTVVPIVDGQASINYTVDEADEDITATSSDAVVVMPIMKPANIAITADPIWIGSNGNVSVNVPNATGNVTIEVNGKSYEVELVDGVATQEIPAEDLVNGENNIVATYNGPEFATNSNETILFVADGVITNATYPYYFDASGNLLAFVPDEATLDFQGLFLGKYPVYINKAVNVVSTTEDALFNSGATYSGNAINSFNFIAGADHSNITGLKFINYCLYIKGASYVTVDNISIVANKRGVGSGTGFLSIHTGAYYTTVKNGYFENGGTGSSLLVLGKGGAYVVFDHNVFNITGSSGNVLSANQFVGTGDAPEHTTYTNNILYSNQAASSICYGMTVSGSGNLVENNTIYFNGSGIINQYGASSVGNVYRNNTIYGSATFNPSANSLVENNKVYGTGLVTIAANTVVVNNTFKKVTVSGAGVNFTENTLSATLTVNSNDNVIQANNITTADTYAVNLGSKTGNNVTDNFLIASELKGDAAVYSESETNIVENNRPYDLKLVVTVDDVVLPDVAVIRVNATIPGTYEIVINDTANTVVSVEVVEAGVEANATIVLGEGSYSANATFDDYFNYTVSLTNATFTVTKGINDIVVIVENTTLPGDVVVNVTANVDDTYTVTIGDYTVDVVVEAGEGSATVAIPAGENYVATTEWENENYTTTITDAVFNVVKGEPLIEVTANSITYGEDLVVKVTSNDTYAYRVNVTVGDQSKLLRLKNGKGTLKFSDLAAGTYTVVALYKGDSDYGVASANTTVKVKKADPQDLIVVSNDITYGDDLLVYVSLSDNVAYRINVTVGDQSQLLRLKEGQGTLRFSGLAAGNYTVVALYKGDANYNAASANASVEVRKAAPADLKIIADSIYYGDDLVVNVALTDNVAYRINVTVGDQSKLLRLKNGQGSVKFSDLEVGTYVVTALYKGDANYSSASASVIVEVKKPQPKNFVLTAESVNYGEDLVVNVSVDDEVANRINVTVGNQSKLLRLKDGKGTLKFSGLSAGAYLVSAVYKGDANYSAVSANAFVEVKKATPNLEVSAKTSGKYVVVDVSSPDQIANRINVTVGNQSKLVRLSEGQGTVKFTGFEAGTYEVTAVYKGDDNYSSATAAASVEIK